MGLYQRIRDAISGSMNNRAEDRLNLERLKKEAAMQEQIIFEQEYKKKALEVAKIRAMEDAERLSGYDKIKAINRAVNLEKPVMSPYKKLADYTRNNLEKTRERIEKNKMIRQVAMEERHKKLNERIQKRNDLMRWRSNGI